QPCSCTEAPQLAARVLAAQGYLVARHLSAQPEPNPGQDERQEDRGHPSGPRLAAADRRPRSDRWRTTARSLGSCARMTMAGFQKFDPYVARCGLSQREAPKVTKPPKARVTLATLGGLGGSHIPDQPWGNTEEERAAVVEYEGRAPRVWAEALARMDPSRPPTEIDRDRWLLF